MSHSKQAAITELRFPQDTFGIELTTSPDAEATLSLQHANVGTVMNPRSLRMPLAASAGVSGDGGRSHSAWFSPDGKSCSVVVYFCGATDAAYVFDVGSGSRILGPIIIPAIRAEDSEGSESERKLNILCLCISPDGERLAIGSDDCFARVFDVASGTEILKTSEHGHFVRAVSFSPDGKRLATGSADRFARMFDVASKVEILKSCEHGSWVVTVQFSPDGKRLATGSYDKYARVFEIAGSESIGTPIGTEIMKSPEHGDHIWSVCFSLDGKRLATGSDDCFARVFDVASGIEILKTIDHGYKVQCVHFSPDGKRLATGSFIYARVFDVASGMEILTLAVGNNDACVPIPFVSFSPDGQRLVTCNYDNEACVFDVSVGMMQLKTVKYGSELSCICFSGDGKSIATCSCSDTVARVYDFASGKEIMRTIECGKDILVASVCLSPDGKRLATSTNDYCARIFDITSGEFFAAEIMKTINHSDAIFSLSFSLDGKRLVTGCCDGVARVFEVPSGTMIFCTCDVGHRIWSVYFSPDGNCFATGGMDRRVCIFDVASGSEEPIKFISHVGTVWSVCFSVDGKRLATACDDYFARVFDVASSIEIFKTSEHEGKVKSVCFSFDGKFLTTGCDDKFARIFLIDHDEEKNQAAVQPCMFFAASLVALSSNNTLALGSGSTLFLAPRQHHFATDGCLPLSSDLLLLWSRLTEDVQKQCFFSDSHAVLSNFFPSTSAPNSDGLVALASKWQDSTFPHVLSTLKRLFEGKVPVVNAGFILRELLHTQPNSKSLPHAATIEALLNNVSQHASFSADDRVLTLQLSRAASMFPSIQSVVNEFWAQKVELSPSPPSVIHNVGQVSFSETTRMYVAASDSLSDPVFENHFKLHPQAKGPPLDYEHLFVPFADASAHRTTVEPSSDDGCNMSLMQALVETGDIDIFGTLAARAIVQHKWQTFGLSLWLKEFFIYIIGLVLLVALDIITWQYWALLPNDFNYVLPADIAVVSTLFGAIILRSLYRETKQFMHSIPSGDGSLLSRILSSDRLKDVWNWLDLLHIMLGFSVVALVWAQSPKSLPVLAVTSFLRWWGSLFYLQAFDKSGPYVRMLVEIVKAIRWFMLIMLISIFATWNAFTLLLKRQCLEPDADATCESPRDTVSLLRTMYDIINTLLFGSGDLNSLENTEYFGVVAFIFIVSMVAMPIVLLNMLIAIMGDSYELIQDRSLRESVKMKASILLEIEMFMTDADKSNRTFFPKFLHVIVPEGEAKTGPNEYQGLMNALKRKVDDSAHDTQVSIQRMQKELEAKLDAESQKHQQETSDLKSQLAQVLQILQSKH